MPDRVLEVFSKLKDNNPPVFIEDISNAAQGWSRSIRRNGGYWLGRFSLTGQADRLAIWFYERLGCHFQERSGGYKTWEGLIYEMDFTVERMTRKRSLDMMYNYVSGTYIDDDGNSGSISAAQNTQSQNRYGRREEYLTLDGYYAAAANAYRDTFLKENAWPWPRVVGAGRSMGEEAKLDVTVSGYIFTANWRFEQVGNGTSDDVDDWLYDIINTDCEFLEPGSLITNTLQVRKDTNQPQRCWDLMLELVDLGDSSNNPYRIYCDNDRRVNYEKISTTVEYNLINGDLYLGAGGKAISNPWMVKPGVVRDLTYPIKTAESGYWFADQRDFYPDEIEVNDSGMTLKSALFEESEIEMAQQNYENMWDAWLRQHKKPKKKK